ncbi:MAG TPA: T9SS type A sorting domain-containing protein [Chitinophagales bacterium]|nr:T9SS type A sorting domain-containing protein [Chitinophagales bacterium]
MRTSGFWGVVLCMLLGSLAVSAQPESEPNDGFTSADVVFAATNVTGTVCPGNDDFFITVLPDDGTLRFTISAANNSGAGHYLYVKGYKGTSAVLSQSPYFNAGETRTEIYHVSCLAADTFYFTIEAGTCMSYSFSYDMLTSGTADAEPNNSRATAIAIQAGETVNGRISYSGATFSDPIDYFVTTLPDDGTLRFAINATNTGNNGQYLYVKGYRGAQAVLNQSPYLDGGQMRTDTFYVSCLAADTFYFTIEASTCMSYSLSYDMLTSGTADAEPNNDFSAATPVGTGSVIQGHIGYASMASSDVNDYFKYPAAVKGSIRMPVHIVNTGGGAYFYFYLYRSPDGSAIYSKTYYVNAGATVTDLLSINCIASDSLFFRFHATGSCFAYNYSFTYIDHQPVVAMNATRLGNEVAFIPSIKNADSHIWHFGDGTTSTLKYPLKNYGYGNFTARLIATNSACNFRDTASQDFVIKGVEYFTPKKSGAGGDAMMQVFGGGLDTATQVILKKGAAEIRPALKYSNARNNELQVMLDLHFADAGLYDVIIEVPGEQTVTFPASFEVEDLKYPYTWSEITGPGLWRINRDTRFTLVVGNTGNIAASGVVVAVAWPKSVDLKFDTKFFRPPASGSYTINTGDTVFTFNYEDIQFVYDSSYNTVTPIDSFAGEPYDGYFRLLMIPHIAPSSTYEIPLIAKSTGSGSKRFITYTYKPNLFGSPCPSGSWMDATENFAVEAIDAIDMGLGLAQMDRTPIGWLAKATKATTIHMANLGQVMGATYNYVTGTTNSLYESLPADFNQNVDAGNAQLASEVLQLGVDHLVDRGASNLMMGKTRQLNQWLADNPGATMSSFRFAIDNLNDINDLRQFIKDSYKTAKDLNTLKQKLERLHQLAQDCPELQRQLEDLINEIDKDMHQRGNKETNTSSVASMDPNAIYGPSGAGAARYVNKKDRQHFMITFENVDSATAAAQIVVVKDTLDASAFDLSTFEFGNITIGSLLHKVPKGRQELVTEIDLAPVRQMKVRVNAWLDTASAVITWQFTAIDPVTGDLPLLEGFLPPNIHAPEGEGSVEYSVNLRSTLTSGALIRSRATIIFDENEPISTNTWENMLDNTPPASSVSATVSAGGKIHLHLTGYDAHSGVGYYSLFVSEDGAEWQPLTGSVQDTLSLTGETGKTYRFYSLSTDKAGNREAKTAAAEAVVTVTGMEKVSAAGSFTIAPNPTNGVISIRPENISGEAAVEILNMLGQTVIRKRLVIEPGKIFALDMSGLEGGLYFVNLRTAKDGKTAAGKVVVNQR